MKNLSFISFFSITLSSIMLFFIAKLLITPYMGSNHYGFNVFNNDKDIETLFIGTSRINTSFDLLSLNKEIPNSSAIWFANITILEIELIARHILSSKQSVKNLVVEISPLGFTKLNDVQTTHFFFELPNHYKKEMAINYWNYFDFSKISNKFLFFLQGHTSNFIFSPVVRYWMQRSHFRGVSRHGKSSMKEDKFKSDRPWGRFIKKDDKFKPSHLKKFIALLDNLKKSEMNITILIPPYSSVLENLRKIQNINRRVKTILKNYNFNVYEFPNIDRTDHNNFHDQHHLSDIGRKRATQDFSKFLRETEKRTLSK